MNWQQVVQILEDYTHQVIPVMYQENYHLRLAKGGPDYPYLAEQSFLGHILNGVFGLLEIIKFVKGNAIFIYGFNESTLRKALALYTIHDLHKFKDYNKMGRSEFSIPLERLQEEYRRLKLIEFAGEIDAHSMRAANASKPSKHQGDLLLSQDDCISLLWLLVRIADTIASVIFPTEAAISLQNYLKDLAPEFKNKYRLYTHEIQDIRGVLTNQIHNCVQARLANDFTLHPIAYFATGTLYIGPKQIDGFSREDLIKSLVKDVMKGMKPSSEMVKSAAKEGLRPKKFDFEKYVYTFSGVETLLEIVLETTTKANAKEVAEDIKQISEKKNAPRGWTDTFEQRFAIFLQESKDFNEKWSLARRYLLYVDALLKELAPELDRLTWLCETFNVPKNVIPNLKADESLFSSGGIGKQIIVPAYHFLKGLDFTERSAEACDSPTVLQFLHQRTIAALQQIDMTQGREKVIEKLGFSSDLTTYLNAQLHLSFAPDAQLSDDALTGYIVTKKKGHSNSVCSICNQTSQYIQSLRTGVLGDSGQNFSNRVLPAKSINELRPWCPICHLEFILRKLTGLSLPSNADYNKSRRIHLYVLPTFSFTPEYARFLGRMLRPLGEITSLPVRDYGEASPGLPHLWLERRELDPEWIDTVINIFHRESNRIATKPAYVGERLLMAKNTLQADFEEEKNNSEGDLAKPEPQPNYYLIPWERSVREGDKDDANIPTRTEAWAKATFAAVVISSLTSSRVYATEQPYLPVSNPGELKATVTLDSPPPMIAKLLGNDQDPKLADRADTVSLYGTEIGNKSGLERSLDLCAALWMITSAVHRTQSSTKDKQIAERLEDVVVNPLAGAHFYREYGRLNDDASPFPVLAKACEILLQYFGGELMELVTKITEKALEIRLPYREYGRGKAHNYELVFREAVDAIRSAFRLVPELRQAALRGRDPSVEAITELKKQAAGTLLKAMERRQLTRRGDGIINPYKKDLGQLVGEFIDLIVDEVFLNRADKSLAQFLKLENSLADGIYYFTDRNISEKWKAYQEAKTKNQDKSETEEVA